MTHYISMYNELLQTLGESAPQTIANVARALAYAGAVEEWDSVTIEDVLTYLTENLPNVPKLNELEYWQAVADDAGVDY